jgi:Domain of unknown function (DUF1735)
LTKMKYLNFSKQFPLILGAIALFSSCKKTQEFQPIGGAGQTIVKLIDAVTENNTSGKAIINLDLLTTPQVVSVVRVLREVSNNTELNRAMTVVVKDDPAAVAAYNTAHATSFVPLPAAQYSVHPDNPRVGGNYTVTLNPGEFAKDIKFILPNAAGLDLNLAYAFAFTITSVDASGKIAAGATTIIVEIGVKNKYDGIYSMVSGFVQRYSGPGPTNPLCCDGLTGPLGPTNPDFELITTGANSNVFSPGVGVTWSNGGGVGGIDGLRLSVDPVTFLVTVQSSGVPTSNATLTNWAGKPNFYNPATKTFTLGFRWNPAAATREYEVVFKYKGPR